VKLGVKTSTSDQGLVGRLAWMTGLRLVFLSLFLTATAFFYLRGDFSERSYSMRLAFGTIGAAFFLAAVYATVLRDGRHLMTLADAQLLLDQLTWTVIVYVSGGPTSGATSFYALTSLVGAILTGTRGAILAAVTGITLYATLCAGFALGWLSPPPDQSPTLYVTSAAALAYPLLINVLGIVVVALLAGYLSERLRITGGALVEATQRADAAEPLAELGRLSAGLAHEIRNPLGSISGSVEMLRESSTLSDEERQLCAIIAREAKRLNNLVTDMLDLARPRPPKPEAVDVASVAREVVALAALSERSGSGDVSVRYEGPPGSTYARCDGAQIRQVLWNLVRNAVQVSPAGKEVWVRVVGGDRGSAPLASGGAAVVALEVGDEGPGIPAEEHARVFDAFYTQRSKGTGIGLAVVKRIIDEHGAVGARIVLLSAPGAGTVFRVELQRSNVASLPPPSVPPRVSRAG
jgi:signal transduction histidine kinase